MVYDLQRDTLTRLTFDPGLDRHPLWSLDGQRVLFSLNREGPLNIYSKAPDGSGAAASVLVGRRAITGHRGWRSNRGFRRCSLSLMSPSTSKGDIRQKDGRHGLVWDG